MKLRTRWSALLLALALALSLTVSAAAEETDAAADPVETAITAAATYGGAVSIQYALWQDGQITDTGASGVYSKTENRLLTTDILYGIGSKVKYFHSIFHFFCLGGSVLHFWAIYQYVL